MFMFEVCEVPQLQEKAMMISSNETVQRDIVTIFAKEQVINCLAQLNAEKNRTNREKVIKRLSMAVIVHNSISMPLELTESQPIEDGAFGIVSVRFK